MIANGFLPQITCQLNSLTAFARTPHDPAAWRGVQANVLGPMGIADPGGASAYSAPSATRDLAIFRDRVLDDVRPHLNGSLVRYARSLRAGQERLERPAEFVRLLNDARDLNVVSSNPAQVMLISAQMVHPELRGMMETPEEGNADFLQYVPLVCIAVLVGRFFFDYPESFLLDVISLFGLFFALVLVGHFFKDISEGLNPFSPKIPYKNSLSLGQEGDVVEWNGERGRIKVYNLNLGSRYSKDWPVWGGSIIDAVGPAGLKPGDVVELTGFKGAEYVKVRHLPMSIDVPLFQKLSAMWQLASSPTFGDNYLEVIRTVVNPLDITLKNRELIRYAKLLTKAHGREINPSSSTLANEMIAQIHPHFDRHILSCIEELRNGSLKFEDLGADYDGLHIDQMLEKVVNATKYSIISPAVADIIIISVATGIDVPEISDDIRARLKEHLNEGAALDRRRETVNHRIAHLIINDRRKLGNYLAQLDAQGDAPVKERRPDPELKSRAPAENRKRLRSQLEIIRATPDDYLVYRRYAPFDKDRVKYLTDHGFDEAYYKQALLDLAKKAITAEELAAVEMVFSEHKMWQYDNIDSHTSIAKFEVVYPGWRDEYLNTVHIGRLEDRSDALEERLASVLDEIEARRKTEFARGGGILASDIPELNLYLVVHDSYQRTDEKWTRGAYIPEHWSYTKNGSRLVAGRYPLYRDGVEVTKWPPKFFIELRKGGPLSRRAGP